MYALTFHLHLEQPVLVTRLGAGEENSGEAYAYIPGSVLRGAAIRLYQEQNPQANPLNQEAQARQLFFSGAVCYLNAYPLTPSGERMLPCPLSWRISKEDKEKKNPEARICDFAIQIDSDLLQPQGLGELFVHLRDGKAHPGYLERYIQVHNASVDVRLKKKRGDSVVYRYEAIAAGQWLGGVIVSRQRQHLELLQTLLDGQEIWLGGARSAGYGLASLGNLQILEKWQETPSHPMTNSKVIVTLLSDAILRDAHGQPALNLDNLLGAEHHSAYQRSAVTGGFNRTWGLPLPQAHALQAGSVFVYQELNQEQLKKLDTWQAEGIGERRLEGFGRITVNWQTQPCLTKQPMQVVTQEHGKPAETIQLSKESRKLAEQMAQRCLRASLDQRLGEALLKMRIEPRPQNAQLSRLRLAARQAQLNGNLGVIVEHVKSLKSAYAQLERARLVYDKTSQRLTTWLEEGLGPEVKIWSYLQPSEIPNVAGIPAQLEQDIQIEYITRLLDALFKKAIDENQGKGAPR